MITLFAMPKPFTGHFGIIQKNAIRSWSLLKPQPEIILFGGDRGTGEVARELNVLHISKVKRNSSGTPLLSDFFDSAATNSRNPLLCYVNADIILRSDFLPTVKRVAAWRPKFLGSGQRWDLDIVAPLNFDAPDWEVTLLQRAKTEGLRRPPNWVDYFVFEKEYGRCLPPFAIGRTSWDNWLVWHALDLGIPVVDFSPCVEVVHQNHDYAHHKAGLAGVWQGEEARENLRLSGGRRRLSSMLEATHAVRVNGIEKLAGQRGRRLRRYLVGAKLDVQIALADWTRPLRNAIGLRKEPPSDSARSLTLK